MKKYTKPANVRPSQEVCAKCSSSGICLAESGKAGYQCPKIVHPNADL